MANTKQAKQPTAAQRLDAIGIDAICERIISGESQASIAASLKINRATFCIWLSSDKRSARARQARILSAQYWDSRAEDALLDLGDDSKAGSIAKARELASHYRWRASKYAPKDYGDKLAVGQADDMQPITVVIKRFSDA